YLQNDQRRLHLVLINAAPAEAQFFYQYPEVWQIHSQHFLTGKTGVACCKGNVWLARDNSH
ncbi:hypothetical protein EX85_15290, partial [Staphylococcus aureus]